MPGFRKDAQGNLVYDTGAGIVAMPSSMMVGEGVTLGGGGANLSPVQAFIRNRTGQAERIKALQEEESDFLARRGAPLGVPPTPWNRAYSTAREASLGARIGAAPPPPAPAAFDPEASYQAYLDLLAGKPSAAPGPRGPRRMAEPPARRAPDGKK